LVDAIWRVRPPAIVLVESEMNRALEEASGDYPGERVAAIMEKNSAIQPKAPRRRRIKRRSSRARSHMRKRAHALLRNEAHASIRRCAQARVIFKSALLRLIRGTSMRRSPNVAATRFQQRPHPHVTHVADVRGSR
jgi:pyruvate kinase